MPLDVIATLDKGDYAGCLVTYGGDTGHGEGIRATESGTSLNIMRRQPDGSWKVHISSLNADVPPLAT